MSMNKKLFAFTIILLSFFAFNCVAFAETCSYKSKDGKTVAKYDTVEVKKTAFTSNENITVVSYKGKRYNKSTNGNQSSNNYTVDKCYEYLGLGKTGGATRSKSKAYESFLYKLGNTIDEVSGSSEVLKLNGFDKESEENVCEYHLNNSTNYNNNIDMKELDLSIKATYAIYFKFITLDNGYRKFTITYDGKTYGDNITFSGSDLVTIPTEITKKSNNETVSFNVESSVIDDFFNCKVSRNYFNLRKDGTLYTLFNDRPNFRDEKGACKEGYVSKDGVTCVKDDNEYLAEDPCGENSIKQVLRFFGYLLLLAKVIIPLIIIGFGTFDLFKAVTDKDEKSLGKQIKTLGVRIFAGIFVFFIPNLVYAVFGLTEKLNVIEQDKYKTCANCLLKPTACDVKDSNDNSDES